MDRTYIYVLASKMLTFVISGDKLRQTVSIFTFLFYSNFSGSNACAL